MPNPEINPETPKQAEERNIKWKYAVPTGTIISISALSNEEWAKMGNNQLIVDEDETYPLFEDTDPDVMKLVTTHGDYLVIAQKLNGHGSLTIVTKV
jgi:hypothetical protein